MKRQLMHNKLAMLVLIAGIVCAYNTQAAWGQGWNQTDGDFNSDGIVNLMDFAMLSQTWLETLPWGPDERPCPRMVAHYRLDGNAEDSAGENNGTTFGNPAWVNGKNAKVGSGAILLNDSDHVSISDSQDLDIPNSITVSAWIKTEKVGAYSTIISKGSSAWTFGLTDTGELNFSCYGLEGNSNITSDLKINDNQWHHVAAVYDQDAARICIYVDGIPDGEGNASGNTTENDSYVWIGGNPEVNGNWWEGVVDHVRIYNYALTVHQIFNQQTWHVDAFSGNDNYNGQGKGKALRTIQEAIDKAVDGDVILVWPGIYNETIFFMGKAITVRSAADAAVIRSPGDYAVNFFIGEKSDSVLEHFVISDSEIGIFIDGSNPTIRNVTVVNNDAGMEVWGGGHPTLSQAIFWNNSEYDFYTEGGYDLDINFSCVQDSYPGEGNINSDPLFVDAANGDYHLKSRHGRFVRNGEPSNSGVGGGDWVQDDLTSPCIDGGNPMENPIAEVMPNGGRLNIGAYGRTNQASKSPWPLKCDINHNGMIEYYDLRILAESWLNEIQ